LVYSPQPHMQNARARACTQSSPAGARSPFPSLFATQLHNQQPALCAGKRFPAPTSTTGCLCPSFQLPATNLTPILHHTQCSSSTYAAVRHKDRKSGYNNEPRHPLSRAEPYFLQPPSRRSGIGIIIPLQRCWCCTARCNAAQGAYTLPPCLFLLLLLRLLLPHETRTTFIDL
jgi:hypothetical protein